MKYLDSILGSSSPVLLGFALSLIGCSDDGLAPPADTDLQSTSGASDDATGLDTSPTTSPPGGGTGGDSTGSGPGDSSGTAGTGTVDTGETDTGSPTNTCEVPRDCVLINDCCQCAAAHIDDEIPECPLECDQPQCDALGIGDIGLVCDDGQCGLETHDCSGNVACDSLPPECPEGTLPEVGRAGGANASCWTGQCIPIAACDPLPSCEYCLANEACVQTVTQIGATYSCKPVPEACNGTPSCACMPADTCETPFDSCGDADGGVIQCECVAC